MVHIIYFSPLLNNPMKQILKLKYSDQDHVYLLYMQDKYATIILVYVISIQP
jgi:hypothetical protein